MPDFDSVPEPRRLPPAWQAAPPAEPPNAGLNVSIRHLLLILRRHLRLVVLATALGLAIGVYLAMQVPALYRATASVRLVGERQSITNEPDVGVQSVKSADPMVSMASLISSRNILRQVVDSLGLQLEPLTPGFRRTLLQDVRVPKGGMADTVRLHFTPDGVEGVLGPRRAKARYGEPLDLGLVQFRVTGPPPVADAIFGVASEEVEADGLLGSLIILQRPETDIINVSFLSSDPLLAQRIVNTVVNVFKAENIRSAQGRSRRKREVLAEQLKRTDSMLAVAKAQLAAFESRQTMASSQNRLTQEQMALANAETRISELQADKRTLTGLLDAVEHGHEHDRDAALQALASGGTVAGGGIIANQYENWNRLRTRLDSITTGRGGLTPNNADVIKLKTLVQTAEQDLIKASHSQVAMIDERIATLQNSHSSTGASLQSLPAMVEEERQLSRDVDRLATKVDNLENEYQAAHMAEAVEAGDIDIVEEAAVPYIREWGAAPLRLSIGLTLGLIFGCSLAFFVEAMNKSIRRPEEIEGTLQIPGLAVIPPLTASGNGHRLRPGIAGLLRGSKRAPVADRSKIGPTGTTSQPFSIGTEAFRMLRTSLIWSDPGAELKTLVVTSAAPGEGKTLTAANLAATFAYEGLRVLLIDCDIRRPRLHGLFRVPRAPGLMELLNASDDGHVSDMSIGETVRATPVKGLSLLACGSLPTDPSALMSGIRMRVLLKQFSASFDLVVLDTPPVLATADAGILGALADGVLLVVRAGQTDRDAARRAQQQLAHVGARVVGAVLNDPGGEVAFEGDYYYPYDYAAE